MTRVKLGDIFEINTGKGLAYVHYILKDASTGELVRVLPGLYSECPDNPSLLAHSTELFFVSFPLTAACKRNIVRRVGHFSPESFKKPKLMRAEHNIRGKFLGWDIVDTETWNRNLVEKLSPDQVRLSPWGIWNDTLLIERLSNGWSLDKWV